MIHEPIDDGWKRTLRRITVLALAVALVTAGAPASATASSVTASPVTSAQLALVDFDVLADGSEPEDGTPVGDAFGGILTVPGGQFGVEFDYVEARDNVYVTDGGDRRIEQLGMAFASPQRFVTLYVKGSEAGRITATGYDADGFEVDLRTRYPDRDPNVLYLSDVGSRDYTRVTFVSESEAAISRINLEAESTYQICIEGDRCATQPVRLFVDRVYLSVEASPVATVTPGATAALVGERVTFDASESTGLAGPIESYNWDFDDDGVPDANGAAAIHAFDAPGEYEVHLTVVDRGSLSNRTTVTVTVNAPPVAALAVLTDAPTAGEPVLFDAGDSTDDGAIAAYEWAFGDGSTATGRAVSHEFADAGQYDVTLTVTDDRGATATGTVTVDVAAAADDAGSGDDPADDPSDPGDGAGGSDPGDGAGGSDPGDGDSAGAPDGDGAGAPDGDGAGALDGDGADGEDTSGGDAAGDGAAGLPFGLDPTTLGVVALALVAVVVALVVGRRTA